MKFSFWIALIIAVFLDLIDYGLVGLIPFIGDFIDIIGIVLLFPFIGFYALLGVVEFVPFVGDILPSFTAAVILYKLKVKEAES